MIPKSEEKNVFGREKVCSSLIFDLLPRVIMPSTIELNCKPGFRTVKIENIATDGMLPAEFPVIKFSVSKMTPQNSLVTRGIPSQVARSSH